MAKTNDSVVIYKSWLETARSHLTEEKANKLMVQLMEYGFDGKLPRNDDPAMDIIFEMAKPNIDSNIQKKINGMKGGRKPGGQPGNKNAKKRITSGLSNVNVNANDNVNVNVNGNDNDNVLPSDGTAAIESAAGSSSEDNDDEWWRTDDAAV